MQVATFGIVDIYAQYGVFCDGNSMRDEGFESNHQLLDFIIRRE
jgi:hypothetical protein